jgi:hypothetical protein
VPAPFKSKSRLEANNAALRHQSRKVPLFFRTVLAAHESAQITASFLPGLIWVLNCLCMS